MVLKHKAVLCNFSNYGNTTKQTAVNGKGLVANSEFLVSLLQLAPWANSSLAQVRDAILSVARAKSLNKGPLTDRAWAGQRTEKVIIMLSHLRRIKKQSYRFDQRIT